MDYKQFCNYVWGMYGNNTISRAWELYKKCQHALWMARAIRAKICKENWESVIGKDVGYNGIDPKLMAKKWKWVERKCLEKAKEFE